jgi:putative YhdH/YhfP family quinone oxidoreductase
MRKYPTVAGIDMAGTVERSNDARFRRGDKVIVTGYDMGVSHDGGYSELVRVPADWIVRRPESMTAFDAMTLGTAGFTAALAIHLMQHNGLQPDNGRVAVTGATGGVGSVAIEILAKSGYHVVAITGKSREADYLKNIGAKEVVLRQSLDFSHVRPLDKATWAGAIDNLGGDVLAWLARTTNFWGNIASIGLAASAELKGTVVPFILRGVNLLGINSVYTPRPLRLAVWQRIASDLKPRHLDAIVTRTLSLDELPQAFEPYVKGAVTGRAVVKIG